MRPEWAIFFRADARSFLSTDCTDGTEGMRPAAVDCAMKVSFDIRSCRCMAALVMISAVCAAALGWSIRAAEATPAGSLRVESQVCAADRDEVTVTFAWVAAGDGPQWIDLSLFDNGFAPRTFIGLGPLDARASRFVWSGILPAARHFARVNTLTNRGWEPSQTLAFSTQGCHVPASSVTVTTTCSATIPGRTTMTAQWQPGDPGIQWVDLSLSNNGFRPWTFLNYGPLAPTADSIVWDGLLEDSAHFLRVNTLTPAGWRSSGTVSFRTPRCAPFTGRGITLTFDDGGPYASQILDILAMKKVPAIFFPYGSWAVSHQALVDRMMAEGHLVGDHTYSHVNLSLLPESEVRSEIARGNVGNSDLFRPVYGIITDEVRAIVQQMGFRVYMWDIDPMDWRKTYAGGDRDIIDEVVSHAHPGAVVLLHLQSPNTPLALPITIDQLRALGYQFIR